MSHRDPVRRLPAHEQWAFVGMGWRPPRRQRRVMHRHIVAALEAMPSLLNVSRAALVRDICARYRVSRHTAYTAIAAARCRMLDLGAPLQLVFTTVEQCHHGISPTFAALSPQRSGCDQHGAMEKPGISAVS